MNHVRLLENIRLPNLVKLTGKYGGVGGGTMLAALRAIDGFAGDKASWKLKLATIAGRMGKSKSSARRAILGLDLLKLLIVHRDRRTGHRASYYQICWSNLQDYDQRSDPEPPDQGSATPLKRRAHGEHSECSWWTHRVFVANTPSVRGEHSSLPPPLSPKSIPPPYREVEEELSTLDIKARGWLLPRLQQSNVPADKFVELIRHWKSKRPAWGEGALVSRLSAESDSASCPASVDKGWPSPSQEYDRNADQVARENERRRRQESERAEEQNFSKNLLPLAPRCKEALRTTPAARDRESDKRRRQDRKRLKRLGRKKAAGPPIQKSLNPG